MIISGNNNIAANILGGRGTRSRNIRQMDLVQERLREREREMRIRERENERIEQMHERMNQLRNPDPDREPMDPEVRNALLQNLATRIEQIFEARARREELAAQREMMRQKAVIAEQTQVEERPEPPSKAEEDPEEEEERRERENIRSLTNIALSIDQYSSLRRNRTMLSARAGQLSRDIGSPNSNTTKVGSAVVVDGVQVHDPVISVQFAGAQDDFRNRELSLFNRAIGRTEAAIHATISSMYRESTRTQESQLAQYRREEEENDSQEAGVDCEA